MTSSCFIQMTNFHIFRTGVRLGMGRQLCRLKLFSIYITKNRTKILEKNVFLRFIFCRFFITCAELNFISCLQVCSVVQNTLITKIKTLLIKYCSRSAERLRIGEIANYLHFSIKRFFLLNKEKVQLKKNFM